MLSTLECVRWPFREGARASLNVIFSAIDYFASLAGDDPGIGP